MLKNTNWRLIISAAVTVAALINFTIIFLAMLLFYVDIFSENQVDAMESYFIVFSVLSPVWVFFISGIFVYFHSNKYKLVQSLITAFLTAVLSLSILILITNSVSRWFHQVYDDRMCVYKVCGE